MFKTFILVASTFFVSNVFASYASIDIQMAMSTIKEGAAAKAKLEKEYKEKQNILQKRKAEVEKMMDSYRQTQMAMNDAKRTQTEQGIQKKMAEYQELAQQSQTQMQQMELQLTKPIADALKLTMKEVAEKGKYELVYEKDQSGVFYARDSVDITNEVIKRYNEVHK